MEVTKKIQIKILETKKYNFCNEKYTQLELEAG